MGSSHIVSMTWEMTPQIRTTHMICTFHDEPLAAKCLNKKKFYLQQKSSQGEGRHKHRPATPTFWASLSPEEVEQQFKN